MQEINLLNDDIYAQDAESWIERYKIGNGYPGGIYGRQFFGSIVSSVLTQISPAIFFALFPRSSRFHKKKKNLDWGRRTEGGGRGRRRKRVGIARERRGIRDLGEADQK